MLSLRPYQQAAIAAIYQYFAEKDGHPLVIIPTAGGKSIVLASFIQGVLQQWPDQRILVITHVRELIAQNHAEMMGLWPEAPAGIYSAGLGKREIDARVLFAGIQSIHRRAYEIQQCDLVLIDEAHLIPRASDTMYRRFLDTLGRINPQLKVIGFTATPYRLDSGLLHQGGERLFTDIAYEVPIRDLIDQGYLSPLVSKATEMTLDVQGVASRGGEFIASQLQAAVDRAPVTQAAIDEIVTYGEGRRSWLVFCSGVEHASHVAEGLRDRGVSCATIFGDTPASERDCIIAAFKRGEIRALASMGVLTTGFNAPAVDLIAMLRPTKSAGLYVQMAGRGTRLAPGKQNCLVLDFAGNVARHGPIDAIKPKQPTEEEGVAPTKVCPDCDSILPAAARLCPDCGHQFPPPEVKVEATATTLAILSTVRPQWLDVAEVSYSRHDKPGKPPSIRVDYRCGLVRHSEWVCLEHTGYARQKAVAWWQARSAQPVPATVTDRRTRATLEIKAFDTTVLTGVKPTGVLLDELHEIAKVAAAERIIGQLRGGLLPNPEGFLVFITTQSDEPPRGAFRAELALGRAIRDGREQGAMLPVLYEFPEDIAQDPADPPAWQDPKNWWMVTPNRDRSVTIKRLEDDWAQARAKGPAEIIRWASQHLNIEIGLALRSDRWVGADLWQRATDPGLTLDALLDRSEVVVIGIDGGGLDDLLGLAVLGREGASRKWLLWSRAWAHGSVLQRRKSEASVLRDFEAAGELAIVNTLGDDIAEVADVCRRVDRSGKLGAVGLDPFGVGAIVDALAQVGIAGNDRVVGITQGWKLTGAIKTAERKLADGTLVHGGSRLMAWAVGNARVEPRGNAIAITKQASGTAKIDPLMAAFNAVALMAMNPKANGRSYLGSSDLMVL